MASAPLKRKAVPAGRVWPEPGPASRPHAPARRPPAPALLSIPIALKFALFITLLVVGIMAWQTTTAMRVAVEGQDAAVNESGVKDVTALAAVLDPSWIEDPKLRPRLDAALQAYCAASEPLGVLNAFVYDSPDGGVAIATGKRGEQTFFLSTAVPVNFRPAADAGVEINELEYNGQPTRRFKKVVMSRRGDAPAPLGRVEVLLSALRIVNARDEIRDRMVTVSLIAAAGAAVLSFCLAAFLTYPIRTLARDIQKVGAGDLEHQSGVKSADEIGALARAFNHMTQNLRQAQDVVVAQKALERELDLATGIQARLLPAGIPKVAGLDVAAYYRPAREVGGDYYDFIRIDQDHLGMVVADVSGKGVPASLVMTMTRSLLRLAAAGQECPRTTIEQVNRVLGPDLSPGMFVTLLYFVLHLPTRRVRLVRAGHNAPLLYVSRLERLLPLKPRGVALGLDGGGGLFASELEVNQFTLHPGDFLVAYTDGIVEGKDREGQCYTDERFAAVVSEKARGGAQSIVEAVLADLQAHRGGAEQSDDITCLVVRQSETA